MNAIYYHKKINELMVKVYHALIDLKVARPSVTIQLLIKKQFDQYIAMFAVPLKLAMMGDYVELDEENEEFATPNNPAPMRYQWENVEQYRLSNNLLDWAGDTLSFDRRQSYNCLYRIILRRSTHFNNLYKICSIERKS